MLHSTVFFANVVFLLILSLSTIKNADMICVVDDGKIVETGTHEELLANESHYHRLVEAQKNKSTGTPPETPVSSEHGSGLSESTIALSTNSEPEGAVMIEFDGVHFEYPSRPDISIFEGLNLKVMEGETLALVGSSGSGKSTVIQLIECFYRPDKGTIKYKGVDVKDLNVRWLRDQLGLVSQEPVLFDASIEENIRYSLPDATHEQVVEAAKQANAHNFIIEFPEGYATSVGQGSTLISGGQKQRIAM
jgi:ABC-type multidrug transport system fused ATPase/permease subunit